MWRMVRHTGMAIFLALGLLAGCDQSTSPAGTDETSKSQTSTDASDFTAGGAIPAGKYVGTITSANVTSTMQYRYSPITGGGMQLVPTVTPMLLPAATGDLVLDGRGHYSLTALKDAPGEPSGGAYRVDSPKLESELPSIQFFDGPLKGSKTSVMFSETGVANIHVTITTPRKDPKPGETVSFDTAINFSGQSPNADAAKRFVRAGIAPAKVAVEAEPAAPKIVPPDYHGFAGTLLVTGKTALSINLKTTAIDSSLPNVYINAHPAARERLYLLTLFRGSEVFLQVTQPDGTELGKAIRAQSFDSVVAPDLSAAISPDGKWIAYYVNYSELVKDTLAMVIYSETRVCDRDGKVIATLKGLTHPTWTPDGKLVVAGTSALPGGPYLPEAKTGLFMLDTLDAQPREIVHGLEAPSAPCVSPDGKRLAFVESKAAWICNIDGTDRKKILTLTGGGTVHSIAWSPDGKAIATCFSGPWGDPAVNIVDIEKDQSLRVFDAAGKVTVSGYKIVWLSDSSN